MREIISTPLRSLGDAFEDIVVNRAGTLLEYADRKVRYPWQYGAVGDGATDDTVALQLWIDENRNNPAGISDLGGITLDGGRRSYLITAPLDFEGMWFLDLRNITIRVGAAGLTDVLIFKGLAFSDISNIYITSPSSYSALYTADNAIRCDRDATYSIVTANTWTNIRIIDLKCKNGFNFGPNSAGYQVDNERLINCDVRGNNSNVSIDTTWWQHAYLIGNGTSGNILNYTLEGCMSSNFRRGVFANAVPVWVKGGSIDSSEIAFYHTGSSSFCIRDMRIEATQRIFKSAATGGFTPTITLDNIQFATDQSATDTYIIDHDVAGTLLIRGLSIVQSTVGTPYRIRMNYGGAAKSLVIDGMRWPHPIADCIVFGGTGYGIVQGFVETDADGLTVAVQSGVHLIGSGGVIEWGAAGSAVDTNLYRSAANVLKTDDKLIVALELNAVGDLNHDGTNIGFYGVAPTTRPTALTAANASALNTGDATSDTVIGNMRTRIGELETKLQALGLLT